MAPEKSLSILYRFRSSPSKAFQALPLSGSVARLVDVKAAIFKTKRLDPRRLDLVISNAETNQLYGDGNIVLHRGVRLVVQRVPAVVPTRQIKRKGEIAEDEAAIPRKKHMKGVPKRLQDRFSQSVEDRAAASTKATTVPASLRHDLDYALMVTSTTIPGYLQCGICKGIVKSPMILPWCCGTTAITDCCCETCIRGELAQNGFRCPLTGAGGVSPDDLIPNKGLQQAANLFVQTVMEQLSAVEKQQVKAKGDEAEKPEQAAGKSVVDEEEGCCLEMKSRGKAAVGDLDEFGGDVFSTGEEKNFKHISNVLDDRCNDKKRYDY